MNSGGHEPSKLDRYCDGLMPAAEAHAFEEEMTANPQLRTQVEAQRWIDSALRRVMVAPAAPRLPQTAAAALPSRWGKIRRSPWIAVAAVLIISICAWRVWDVYHERPEKEEQYVGGVPRTMDQIYKVEKDRGFVPMWVCRNDKEFATTFWKNLGAALTFRDPPADVASLGLSYGNTVDLSPKTVYMLFKVNGREVIVFIDKKENDHKPKSSTPGLNLFRREAGQFVLYELTPFDQPKVYDRFQPFDMPKEWIQ
jgi:hypothetical protein